MEDRLITMTELKRLTGFSHAAIYGFISRGRFPEPVKIGHRSRWRLAEVRAWMDALPRGVLGSEVA